MTAECNALGRVLYCLTLYWYMLHYFWQMSDDLHRASTAVIPLLLHMHLMHNYLQYEACKFITVNKSMQQMCESIITVHVLPNIKLEYSGNYIPERITLQHNITSHCLKGRS
jgi:hypothetical protein